MGSLTQYHMIVLLLHYNKRQTLPPRAGTLHTNPILRHAVWRILHARLVHGFGWCSGTDQFGYIFTDRNQTRTGRQPRQNVRQRIQTSTVSTQSTIFYVMWARAQIHFMPWDGMATQQPTTPSQQVSTYHPTLPHINCRMTSTDTGRTTIMRLIGKMT